MYLDWNPDQHYVILQRKQGDPRLRTESQLLAHLQRALREHLGVVLIKRLMAKDGHMVADTQHYLRSPMAFYRRGAGCAVYDTEYSIRDSARDYNTFRPVRFFIDTLANTVFCP